MSQQASKPLLYTGILKQKWWGKISAIVGLGLCVGVVLEWCRIIVEMPSAVFDTPLEFKSRRSAHETVQSQTSPFRHFFKDQTSPFRHFFRDQTSPFGHFFRDQTSPFRHFFRDQTSPFRHFFRDQTSPFRHSSGGLRACGLYLELVSSTKDIQSSHARVQFCEFDHVAWFCVVCVCVCTYACMHTWIYKYWARWASSFANFDHVASILRGVRVCVCAYTHIYTHTYIRTFSWFMCTAKTSGSTMKTWPLRLSSYACDVLSVHMCVCMYVCMHVCMHVCMKTWPLRLSSYACDVLSVHVCMYMYIVCLCVCVS